MRRIYLDYAASTPMMPEILKAMKPYWGEKYGNPNSLHWFGQEARAAVDKARETIAQAIGSSPSSGFREIVFTGSATEANNLTLRGVLKEFRIQNLASDKSQNSKFSLPNPKIIVSAIEHESILETARDLRKDGVEIIYLPVNKQGIVDLEKLKSVLDERTILVSVMFVNNEIGSIQPIAEMAKIIKTFRETKISAESSKKNYSDFSETFIDLSHYPLFHTDAAQAFQYFDCHPQKLGVDLMTLSGHKIYGPKGIGVLYINSKHETRKTKQIKNVSDLQLVSPIVTGGGQEFGLRSGTENVAEIVSFAKAAEIVQKNRQKEVKKISGFKKYFFNQLKKIYPEAEVNGEIKKSAPHILNVYFPRQDAFELFFKLDKAGVAVSLGSACSSRADQPSHVLLAMGFSESRARSSLRFSFGKYTTKEELQLTLKILKRILEPVIFK